MKDQVIELMKNVLLMQQALTSNENKLEKLYVDTANTEESITEIKEQLAQNLITLSKELNR